MEEKAATKRVTSAHSSGPSHHLEPAVRETLRRRSGLSPREFEVLLGVMDGLTNRQIAERLECSPSTVNSHLRRMFAKLAVSSRAMLVAAVLV